MINAELRYDQLIFPAALLTRSDLARLLLEIEQIDNQYQSMEIRQRVQSRVDNNFAISPRLEDFLSVNNQMLDDPAQRQILIKQLRLLKEKAPVVHMTFAVSADQQSLSTIIDWLRNKIHKQILIEIGMQPSLVAGVSLRTTNQVFDFSMRTALRGRRDILVEALRSK